MPHNVRLEVITIGDELLDGRVVDTNTTRLASFLADVGGRISQRTSIVDDIEVIVSQGRACIDRGTGLCVVSGGLGPTTDDITAEAFAQLAGVELVRDAQIEADLEARFAQRGIPFSDNQRRQADRPAGSELLHNSRGTAPGFALTVSGCRFVAVPGVPNEFDAMVQQAVIEPWPTQGRPAPKRSLRVFGLPEGEVGQRLLEVERRWPTVRVGYRAKIPEIHVTLSHQPDAAGASADAVSKDLGDAAAFCREQLGQHIFAESEVGLPEVVLQMLKERGATLAAAESCTGGLIGDMLTDVSGASEVFLASIVAYQNEVKVALLGVTEEVLRREGAVSDQVVMQMAKGVRQRSGATWGIAVSGIAGPEGGTPDKPVGTICIAIDAEGTTTSKRLSLPFRRRANKQVSAYAVLDLLRRALIGAS